jgi:anaerobic selenocysteine-containing dehydrogenase
MKIDRRSFLAFAFGGAAGTVLSPLPWKLMDDISIWSQNWPWTPMPEDGEISYATTTCTLCPGGCGLYVRKSGQRVIKLEGQTGHPVNDGGICTLGASAAQLLYSPTRIKRPMKKVNGRWLSLSWEAAIGEIAAKLTEMRNNGSSHKLACISGTDRGILPALFHRFLTVYGSPNFMRMPSIEDSYEAALYLTQGVRAMAGFDLANSDFILSFGSGLIEGWASPVYMFRAKGTMSENGGRLDQVEPRLSKTAAKSKNWVAVNPGTEGALAWGLAHVIIKDGLYDRQFVQSSCSGFEEFKKFVIEGYTPGNVSQVAGVDSKAIEKLARDFARADRPVAICGRGRGSSPGGLQEILAVHLLNALVGSINNVGGIQAVPEPDYVSWPDVEMDDVASAGMQLPRIDGAGTDDYRHARYLATRLPEVINTSQQTEIQMLFVTGANPLYSLPDTQAVEKAFEKIETVVSFSSFMDETTARADIVLPQHFFLERYDDVAAVRGFPESIIGLVQPVIDPLYDTRHSGDVLIQIAGELGDTIADAFGWDSYEACLEETLADKWDTLVEQGFWTDDNFAGGSRPAAFETDTGKFEFSNNDIAVLPPYRPFKAKGDETRYPLVLIPYDTLRLSSEYIGSPPFLVKALEDTILTANDVHIEINPVTAKEAGLKDGSYAVLKTPKGSGRVRIRLFEGIMPGVIALPRGLGHTAYDKYLANKGVNVNTLMAPLQDPATGHDAGWGIRARLSQA